MAATGDLYLLTKNPVLGNVNIHLPVPEWSPLTVPVLQSPPWSSQFPQASINSWQIYGGDYLCQAAWQMRR
jgi:hypothetical protein